MSHPTQNLQTTGPTPGGQKPKGRKNSTSSLRNRYLKHSKLKEKKNEKRNTVQMKKQPRNTQAQINEEEVGKLPEKESRITAVEMIQNLKSTMEKMQESINKDLEEIKNEHTETNDTITEIKNTPEGINSRIPEPEGQPSDLEDRMVEIIAKEQNKVKGMKIIEDSLRDLWDTIKHTNIQIIGIPEEEKGRV